jgi:hypothetical protein
LYSQYNNGIPCDNEEEINFCAQSKDGETWTVPSLTNIENTDTVHYETFDNSDTGSWNSDTPLLLVVNEPIESKLPEIVDVSEKTEMDKNSVTSLNVVQNDAHTTVTVDETNENIKNKEDIFGSDLSIAYSIVHDFEVVQTNPVNVFGSGWEFGSVCSIYGSGDVYKSHSNTVERLGFNPLSNGPDRLLSRIFKEKIGSMQFDKSMFGESTKFTNDDKTIDIAAPVKTKNLKNLLILSIGVTLLHIAIFGLRNLQSSMNSEGGLGVYSLATLFGAFMFGSLASPFIVQRYKPKLCMSVSCFGHLVYVVANYFPSFYVIIPASVIYGLSNALLWNALCTYITELGLDEAFLKSKITSNVLSRYFGIFFLVLQMSMVLGNLISSIIFSQSDKRMQLHQDDRAITENINNASTIIYEFISNGTGTELTDINFNEAVAKGKCGAAHCELSSDSESESNVDDLDKLFLLGTYSSCAVLSILVIQCFLDKLPNYTPHRLTLRESLKQAGSVVAMVIDPKFCFIVMLCLYTVISNGFVVADVLKVMV